MSEYLKNLERTFEMEKKKINVLTRSKARSKLTPEQSGTNEYVTVDDDFLSYVPIQFTDDGTCVYKDKVSYILKLESNGEFMKLIRNEVIPLCRKLKIEKVKLSASMVNNLESGKTFTEMLKRYFAANEIKLKIVARTHFVEEWAGGQRILYDFHQSPCGGHTGERITVKRIRQYYEWHGLRLI